MNLASKTAPVSLTSPSSVAAIQGIVRWTAWRWMSEIRWPELSSYQRRLRSSVTKPSWTIRTPDRSGGGDLAALFRPEPEKGLLVFAHDDPGIRAADEVTPIEMRVALGIWKFLV